MNNIKQKSDLTNPGRTGKGQEMTDNGRRSFMWKAGAVFSATLSSVLLGVRPGHGKTANRKEKTSQLYNRIEQMENSDTIRSLNHSYTSSLGLGMYEEAIKMFTDDGKVIFNSGIYSGKDTGIRRLHCKLFRDGRTGRATTPPIGMHFMQDSKTDLLQYQDTVKVDIGCRFADGQFPYFIHVGIPMAVDCSLAEMARLQGEGIMKWWESGICKASYLKMDKTWKIKRLEYKAYSRVMYRNGWSNPKPVHIPVFSKTYPEDLSGPDRLV